MARLLVLLLCAGCSAPDARRAAIIGGVRDRGDPAVVMLVSYPSDLSTFFTCTASLIAPSLLVTAAHCVDAPNHPGHSFGAFLGDDASAYATAAAIVPELAPIDAVHAHPQYNPAPPFVADIAVAVLHTPLTITPLPINRDPLPPSLTGQPTRIVGYGQTTYLQLNRAKYAASTIVGALPPDDTVVVGDAVHRSCIGDSGGPALTLLDGKETLFGVDSYTDTTGCTEPSHYRRIDRYTAFLDQYLPPPPPPDLSEIRDAGAATDAAISIAAIAPATVLLTVIIRPHDSRGDHSMAGPGGKGAIGPLATWRPRNTRLMR